MGSHSTKGPSRFARLKLCPASYRREQALNAELGEEPSGPAAEFGTRSHKRLEDGIVLSLDPALMISPTATDEVILEGEYAGVAWMYAQQWLEDHPGGGVFPERRVDPGAYIGRDDMAGTADLTLLAPGFLEVVDFKTGRNVVEPDSAQNRLYLLGVLYEYWPDWAVPCPFQTIRSTIIQPSAAHPKGPTRSVDYTVDELIGFLQECRTAAYAADQPDAVAVPGEEQCKYCRARKEGRCSEYNAWALGETLGGAGVDVSQVPTDGAINAAIDPANLGTLEPLRLARMYELLPSLSNFADAVTAEVRNRLSRGETVPGYKMVRGTGNPKWKVDQKQVLKEFRGLKLKKAQYTKESLMTPLQCMKIKDLTEDQSAHIATLWERPEGALAIKPESDPAPSAFGWMETLK